MSAMLIGLVLLVILAIGSMIVFSTSNHSGEQFAVDGFQRRSFSYFEAFGIRLSATTYFNRTGNLELDLAKKKWIKDSGKPPKDDQWVTVEHIAHGAMYTSDADILVKYLEFTQSNGAIDFDAWNTKYPGYAAIMWPEIQTAAEGNMYILVPDIIHHMLELNANSKNPFVRGKKNKDLPDPEKLSKQEKAALEAQQQQAAKKSLYPFLENLYREAGKAAQEANEMKRAKFCFEQVLRFAPESKDIQAELDKFPAKFADETPSEDERPTEENAEVEIEK